MNIQWRSQPENLVALWKFHIITIIHFFTNWLFSQSVKSNYMHSGTKSSGWLRYCEHPVFNNLYFDTTVTKVWISVIYMLLTAVIYIYIISFSVGSEATPTIWSCYANLNHQKFSRNKIAEFLYTVVIFKAYRPELLNFELSHTKSYYKLSCILSFLCLRLFRRNICF